jgi:hypothetical protein
MRRAAALAVSLLGLSCSDGGLNPEFAKAWRMGIALDIPGLTSFNYGETVAITVAGTTGVANNVCPTGGG